MSTANPSHAWEQAFGARLRPLLARMRAGEDVPPALWYRAEGFAEAGLACGAIDAQALAVLLERVYTQELGADIVTRFGENTSTWIDEQGGRVQLRFRLPRAPVYPGKPV